MLSLLVVAIAYPQAPTVQGYMNLVGMINDDAYIYGQYTQDDGSVVCFGKNITNVNGMPVDGAFVLDGDDILSGSVKDGTHGILDFQGEKYTFGEGGVFTLGTRALVFGIEGFISFGFADEERGYCLFVQELPYDNTFGFRSRILLWDGVDTTTILPYGTLVRCLEQKGDYLFIGGENHHYESFLKFDLISQEFVDLSASEEWEGWPLEYIEILDMKLFQGKLTVAAGMSGGGVYQQSNAGWYVNYSEDMLGSFGDIEDLYNSPDGETLYITTEDPGNGDELSEILFSNNVKDWTEFIDQRGAKIGGGGNCHVIFTKGYTWLVAKQTFGGGLRCATDEEVQEYSYELGDIWVLKDTYNTFTSVEDQKDANLLYLYPNPANDHLEISGLMGIGTIYTLEGKLLEKVSSGTLNTSDYLPGIYFIRTENGQSARFMIAN